MYQYFHFIKSSKTNPMTVVSLRDWIQSSHGLSGWKVSLGPRGDSWHDLEDCAESDDFVTLGQEEHQLSVHVYPVNERLFRLDMVRHVSGPLQEAMIKSFKTVPESIDSVYGGVFYTGQGDVAFDPTRGVLQGLRDVYPINFYGQEYVSLIEEKVLQSIPDTQADIVGGCCILDARRAYEKASDSNSIRLEMIRHIGSEFFVPGAPRSAHQAGPGGGVIGLMDLVRLFRRTPNINDETAERHL